MDLYLLADNSGMTRFFVRLFAGPAVMLQGPEALFTLNVTDSTVGDPAIRVTNRVERNSRGNTWISGLQFDVRLNAANVDEAVSRSRQACEYLSTLMSILSVIGLPSLKLELAMDIDSMSREHRFLQVFYPEFRDSSRRWMHLPHLVEFLAALEKFPQREQKPLLFRSFSFYRRALQFADPLEHFVLLFFALETLNYPLAVKHGVSLKTKWEGVRTHYAQRKDGIQEFGRCRKLRNGFVHGEVDVARMSMEADLLGPKLRRTLIDAYACLLSFAPKPLMQDQPMRLDEGLEFQLLSTFTPLLEGNLDEKVEPPKLVAVFEEMHVDLPPDHHSQVKGRIRLQNSAAGRVVFKLPELRVIGEGLRELQTAIEMGSQ